MTPSKDAVVLPRVLVIDDERGTRESLRLALQRDYQVFTAASVEEGLDLLTRDTFDAVLLDLRLPGVDGIEGLRRIRDLDANVAVVILTAYATMETAVQALRLGANDYRTKPFDVADLLGVVRRNIAFRQTARRRDAALAHDLQRINDNLAGRIMNDEHLAHLGQLAAALVHDLNGPLTNLTLSLDLLRGDALAVERQPAAVRQAIEGYIENTRTTLNLMTGMIRGHQRFARQGRKETERLLVDELLGQHQVVIKSMEKNYRKVDGTAGATILGDGRVALILDVVDMVRLWRNR